MPWLTLDLDGTLAAWPFGRAVLTRLREHFTHPDSAATIRREYLRRLGSERPADAYDWDGIHEAARLELGLGALPSLEALAAEASFAPDLVYPDVRPALARFRAAGWRLAVATNGYARHQRLALRALDLEQGFEPEVFLAPDTTGFVKPQGGFLAAMRDMTGDPDALEGLVHVGDLLAQDMLAANRAGVGAAWVWRPMPEAVRAIPVLERAGNAEVLAAIEREFPAEIERDGRMGELYDNVMPSPDYVVADLLELADALLGPAA